MFLENGGQKCRTYFTAPAIGHRQGRLLLSLWQWCAAAISLGDGWLVFLVGCTIYEECRCARFRLAWIEEDSPQSLGKENACSGNRRQLQ